MDTTENYGFPLPSPSNTLEEDVYHIVDAFKGVDGKLHELDTDADEQGESITAMAQTVDSVQEQMLAALAATAETEVRVAAMEAKITELSAGDVVL